MRPALRRRTGPRSPAISREEIERRIVDALRVSPAALSAYELLDRLSGQGTRFPTSIYRALDRLHAAGAIERVEVKSAYRLRGSVGSVLVSCTDCGRTIAEPATGARSDIALGLADLGYIVDRVVLEAIGRCPACVDEHPPLSSGETAAY